MSEQGRFRKKRVTFFLSDLELEKLNEIVRKRGLSREDYVRERLAISLIIFYKPFEVKDHQSDLYKMGQAVNQIAREVNTQGYVSPVEADELREQYENLVELIGEHKELYEKK